VAVLDVVDGWAAPHAAAAVVGPGGVIETHGPVERRFPLASVTKLLTTIAALVAVEEGSLDLDAPAGPAGATIRHLLAHASGLPPDDDGRAVPIARPGTRRIYSNVGFEVLGEQIAAATGVAFSAYAREAVCEPLGLRATDVSGSPASGAMSTVADLALVARELLRPRVVAPETLAIATAVQFPGLAGVLPGFGRQDPNDWGLGFECRDHKAPHWTGTANSPATFGHFGRTGTFLWVDPTADLALVCLTDREFGPWAAAAWPALADALLASSGRRRGIPRDP
jgi:CubicO group peptidase (beta-lactamase class C family)